MSVLLIVRNKTRSLRNGLLHIKQKANLDDIPPFIAMTSWASSKMAIAPIWNVSHISAIPSQSPIPCTWLESVPLPKPLCQKLVSVKDGVKSRRCGNVLPWFS